MLKIKQQLNYRRGYTHSHCSQCNHYEPECKLTGINGRDMGLKPRCKLIGLEPGRAYSVSANNICDRFDNSALLKRLGAHRVAG